MKDKSRFESEWVSLRFSKVDVGNPQEVANSSCGSIEQTITL
jgi:hypothetical protein